MINCCLRQNKPPRCTNEDKQKRSVKTQSAGVQTVRRPDAAQNIGNIGSQTGAISSPKAHIRKNSEWEPSPWAKTFVKWANNDGEKPGQHSNPNH